MKAPCSDTGSNPALLHTVNHGTSHVSLSHLGNSGEATGSSSGSLEQFTGYMHTGSSTSGHSCTHPAGTLCGSTSPTHRAWPRALYHSPTSLSDLNPAYFSCSGCLVQSVLHDPVTGPLVQLFPLWAALPHRSVWPTLTSSLLESHSLREAYPDQPAPSSWPSPYTFFSPHHSSSYNLLYNLCVFCPSASTRMWVPQKQGSLCSLMYSKKLKQCWSSHGHAKVIYGVNDFSRTHF